MRTLALVLVIAAAAASVQAAGTLTLLNDSGSLFARGWFNHDETLHEWTHEHAGRLRGLPHVKVAQQFEPADTLPSDILAEARCYSIPGSIISLQTRVESLSNRQFGAIEGGSATASLNWLLLVGDEAVPLQVDASACGGDASWASVVVTDVLSGVKVIDLFVDIGGSGQFASLSPNRQYMLSIQTEALRDPYGDPFAEANVWTDAMLMPEPATAALLLSGIAATVGRRRRNRRRL